MSTPKKSNEPRDQITSHDLSPLSCIDVHKTDMKKKIMSVHGVNKISCTFEL